MPTFVLSILFFLCLVQPNSTLAAYTSPPPPLSITKIGQGELLDKAKSATFEDFFESWMDKNPKKATQGSWIILYKNEKFLYWGWTTFEILMSSDPTVKEFFKTPINEVQEKFPNYKEVHGISIRDKIVEYITKAIAKKANVTVELGFETHLIGESIVIQTDCTIKPTGEESEKVTYNVILHRDTLELIKLAIAD